MTPRVGPDFPFQNILVLEMMESHSELCKGHPTGLSVIASCVHPSPNCDLQQLRYISFQQLIQLCVCCILLEIWILHKDSTQFCAYNCSSGRIDEKSSARLSRLGKRPNRNCAKWQPREAK